MKIKLFFLFCSFAVFAQNDYPKDYFMSPLDIPLLLSGGFGELRSNHFHTGLDFKTQQKEGFKVYATADGYISRIKISTFGYGKAIYIDHPNGLTTVYGHLQKTNAPIEAFIKAQHYKEKSFEIEVFPNPTDLPIKKGDIIAFSGNTGGSGGPHLHFEFRDTKTENIINPMLFGFDTKVTDTKPPVVTTLMAYPVEDNAIVNRSQKPILINLSQQKDGSLLAEKVLASGKISFGISAYDMFDFTYNKNGIYKVKTFSNGKPFFGYQFDSFAFDESKHINALLDFERFKNTGVRIQRLFMKNPYGLNLIQSDENRGIIDVLPNLNYVYKIEVSDFKNNTVIVNVPIVYSPLLPKIFKTEKTTPFLLKAKNDNNYKKDNVSVFIPAGTFYDDLYLNFDVKNDTLTLQDDTVALQNNVTVTFENNTFTTLQKEKIFIASIEGKKLRFNFTKIKGNGFVTNTKNLGKFVLASDTVAPSITALNIPQGKWLSNQNNLQLAIGDSLSGVKKYDGYLNGKWILFEYDFKTKRIIHYFDDNFIVDGKNDLRIIVSDNAGNSTIFETYFFRKKL